MTSYYIVFLFSDFIVVVVVSVTNINIFIFDFTVHITPVGPLSIPINEQRVIRCDVIGVFTVWSAVFRDVMATEIFNESVFAPDIVITQLNRTSSTIVLNTANTELIAVICEGRVPGGVAEIARLNLTIYGECVKH